MLARRAAIARRYHRAWATLPLGRPCTPADRTHAYHRFLVRTSGPAARMAAALSRRGVTARLPVFQPIHRTLGLSGFPGATEAFRRALSVPLYPSLTVHEQLAVVAAVRGAST
jgi:dTDP-4-amino-4,6-dideoxygalactose transaminase